MSCISKLFEEIKAINILQKLNYSDGDYLNSKKKTKYIENIFPRVFKMIELMQNLQKSNVDSPKNHRPVSVISNMWENVSQVRKSDYLSNI